MKKRYTTWVATALIITGLGSCYDFSKLENIEIEPISPKMVFPMVNSTITFKDLVEHDDANTLAIVKPGDSRLYLIFRDTLEMGSAESEFTIPSVVFNKTFQSPISTTLPSGQTQTLPVQQFSETYSPIGSAELKEVRLSQGSLISTITNNFNNTISGTIEITSLKDLSGSSLTVTIPPIAAGQTTSLSHNLEGHILSLYNSGAGTYNTFSFEAEITVTSQGQPITTSDKVAFQISLNNLDYTYIVGKINQAIPVADYDFAVDLFRSTYIADQHFEEPKLSFEITNGYGIPVALSINSFVAKNTLNNESLPLANEGTPNATTLLLGSPNNINYIQTIGNPPAEDSLGLTKTNSNIENLFDIAPNQFHFQSGITLGDGSNNHDYFIAKNSNLSIASEIELPLVGWVETNQINDTIVDLDLPDLEAELNLNETDSLKITLKFKFNNNIPLDTYFQAYFLNDKNQELTRLFADELWLIKSAQINPVSGVAINPTSAYSEAIVTRSKYSLMQDATKMVLQFRFKTGGETHQVVTIENTNYIDVQMSVIAEGTVNFDI